MDQDKSDNMLSEIQHTSSAKELGNGPLTFTEGPIFEVRRSNSKASAGHCIRALLEQLHHSLTDDWGCWTRLEEPGHGTGLAAVPTCPPPSPTTSAWGIFELCNHTSWLSPCTVLYHCVSLVTGLLMKEATSDQAGKAEA